MQLKYVNNNMNGFTIIELLLVMAIAGLLAGMLFVLIGGADEKNNEMEMNLLISRLVEGCKQFENVTGDIPLPTGDRNNPLSGTWYPATEDGSWDKQQLWWRLSSEMQESDWIAAETFAQQQDEAADPYQSEVYLKKKHPGLTWGIIPFKEAALDVVSDSEAEKYKGVFTGPAWDTCSSRAVSNGASGDINHYLPIFTHRGSVKRKILQMRGAIARDIGMRTYQTMSILSTDDIGKEFIAGDTILDLWGNPLIFIAHSTRGVKYVDPWSPSGHQGIPIGAAPGGRKEVDDRNQDGVINDDDWIVEPTANKKGDWNEDGSINVHDWDNMLYNARPTRGRSVYIASAGEDGLFNVLRTQPVNDDNIENKLEE